MSAAEEIRADLQRIAELECFRVTVYGDAQPAGSKRAYIQGGRAIVVDAAKKSRPWKNNVAQVAGQHFKGALWDGPISVTFIFYRPRPRSHYGTGRNAGIVKGSAPAFPTTRPDALKLARAVEDALSGIVWTDDARIVVELLEKRWGEPARVEITAQRLD